MTPRQISDRIAQRASRTVATAALALGLIATAFSPLSALAAPTQDFLPDLVVGTLYAKSIDVGETATIPVIVKNNGATAATVIDVYLNLGPGLGLLDVQAGTLRCSSPVRSNLDGSTTVNCSTSVALQPGQYKMIGLKVHGEPRQPAENFWLAVSADPYHRLPESNEDNNVSIDHF